MKKFLLNNTGLLYITTLFILFGINSCKKDKKTSGQSQALPIEVAYPVVQDVELKENYPGYLQAIQTANIVAQVSGTLQKVLYTPGDYVSEGTLLFVIDPTIYNDKVLEAEAAVSQSQATLDYNKATYERTAEAYKSNAVSEIQVIQTKANYDQAVAALKTSLAQMEQAKTNLNYCYVKAPFNGRVTVNAYDMGNYITESQTLASIYQDNKLYVYFSVSDNQYLSMAVKDNKPSNLQQMHELIVQPNSEDNIQQFKAKIDYFAPNIELSTGTINMRGIIDNKDGLLLDGLYVKVILPYKTEQNAILIPDASIGKDQLGSYVFVVNDSSKVEMKRVELGQLTDNAQRIINSGLNKDDKYVTTALLKVRSGMTVDPILADKNKKK